MEYTTKGIVVDMSQHALKGVQVEDGANIVFTNIKGEFSIDGDWDEKSSLKLTFSLKDYNNKTKRITTLTNTVKEDIGVVELKTTKDNKTQNQKELEKLNADSLKSKLKSSSDTLAITSINNLAGTITRTSLPVIFDLLSQFGINSPLENPNPTQGISCPPSEILKAIVEKRNKLSTQLNNIYLSASNTLKTVEGLENVVSIFESLFSTLKLLPIPTLPPGIPSIVPQIQDLKNQFLSPNISKLASLTTGLTLSLSTLVERLQQMLNLLNSLDSQIQNCSEGDDTELVEINEVLLELNSQQTSQTPQSDQPQNLNVNGFNFDVETEPTTNNLKRIRAIAKNAQGVIILRGEYSFSASNQILINELVFYIQVNDLKAD
tara:strand:- start:1530 stop:2660 length:1131 start_codon:yes stop_codon:yes gene_type:complete